MVKRKEKKKVPPMSAGGVTASSSLKQPSCLFVYVRRIEGGVFFFFFKRERKISHHRRKRHLLSFKACYSFQVLYLEITFSNPVPWSSNDRDRFFPLFITAALDVPQGISIQRIFNPPLKKIKWPWCVFCTEYSSRTDRENIRSAVRSIFLHGVWEHTHHFKH